MKQLEAKLKQIDGGKVLDVATGGGNFIHYIKEFNSFDSITAIDTSEKPKDLISKQFPDINISFRVMDAGKMDFPDETFDTVTISNSLHHMKEPIQTMKEIHRVLKKDGKLIINEMYSDRDNQDKSQVSHILIHEWSAKIDTIAGINHNPTYKKEELINFMKGVIPEQYEVIDYKHPAEDPKNKEIIDNIVGRFSASLERIKDKPEYESLKKEGEEIEKYVYDNGFASASSLFILGYK
jgi:ubiquinone/menaquinone biosynthesis C-methylase UbiE